uniref:Proteasome subunit beta n=1 Tax=Zeugodacus cucurbitae TaxID=28588 RepID=A0A0A1WFW3_ZEUCU
MCECCHSCSHCDAYAKRRCVSCSCTHLGEPSSMKRYCRHHRWTCPCCCKKYFRSHSVCGLFPNNKRSKSDEFKFYERHLTGHYLKMKSSSVTDLYRSYALAQKGSAKKKLRKSLCNTVKSCRKSRRDTLPHEVIPHCSPSILQRLDVDYESYKSFMDIPLTYCPTCEDAQYNSNYRMGESYHDYLERLKRSIYSFKDTANSPNELVGNHFLNDLNKLYASVGGGMQHKGTQKDTNVSLETQTLWPNPSEAMREYRAFFGGGHKSRRSFHIRRSSSYRRRSRTPSKTNVGVQYDNWPPYGRRKYSYHVLEHKKQDRPSKSTQRTSSRSSDFVLKYPTRLLPNSRARLSMSIGDRHALMGSLISSRSSKSSIDFDLYERRHTIHA